MVIEKQRALRIVLWGLAIVLGIGTVVIFLDTASYEPYFKLRNAEAYEELIWSTVLIVLWSQLICIATYSMVKRLHITGAVVTIAAAWSIWFLSSVQKAYLGDLSRFACPGVGETFRGWSPK